MPIMAASLPGRRASLAALLVVLATISVQVDAHIAAWNPGMYCMNVRMFSKTLFDLQADRTSCYSCTSGYYRTLRSYQ